MVATNTASDLELCASTYRHFSPAGFSSEIFIVENNSRVIQKTNNKRIEKIKREDILRENFQIYGMYSHSVYVHAAGMYHVCVYVHVACMSVQFLCLEK